MIEPLTVRALLKSVSSADLHDLIVEALNVLDEREQPPAEDLRLHAEIRTGFAEIARDRRTGLFGAVWWSEGSAVEAALERGGNVRGEGLAQAYEAQRAV